MNLNLGASDAIFPDRILINPGKDYVYIPIYKNASIYGDKFFSHKGWDRKSIFTLEEYHSNLINKKIIVFLRDPVERWFSGVAQYFYEKEKRNENSIFTFTEDQLIDIFSGVRLDHHTEPQTAWLLGLDLGKITFFNLNDENFPSKLTGWINTHSNNKLRLPGIKHLIFKTQIVQYNTSTSSSLKKRLTKELKIYAEAYPQKLDAVKHFYRSDMKLYKMICNNKLTWNK